MKVIVIAGTSSGVGKTSISVGIMRALRYFSVPSVVNSRVPEHIKTRLFDALAFARKLY